MEKIRVIIVEDSAEYANIVSNYLSRYSKVSIEVVGIAHTGPAGLEIVDALRPDIVLVDLILPIMDGYTLIEKINKISDYDPIIFVLSAAGTNHVIKRVYSLGAEELYLKPFDLELLSRHIIDKSYEKKYIEKKLESVQVRELPSLHVVLQSLGFDPHLTGYKYLLTGISAAVEDTSLLDSLTKILYPYIAKEYTTCPMSVERSIRYALKKARERDEFERYSQYIITTDKRQLIAPSNGHFIISLVHYYSHYEEFDLA